MRALLWGLALGVAGGALLFLAQLAWGWLAFIIEARKAGRDFRKELDL